MTTSSPALPSATPGPDIDPVAGDLEIYSFLGAVYGGWARDWYINTSTGYHGFNAQPKGLSAAIDADRRNSPKPSTITLTRGNI